MRAIRRRPSRSRCITDVETPQVRAIPIAAASTVGLYLLYLLVRFLAPRTSVIAAATAKETIAQPLFTMLMMGVVALVAFVFIPYNTFGEDVKMLKTSGMTMIKVLGDHHGPLDGEHVGRRRNRRPHGPHRAVEAGRPASVHHRQVPRHHLADRADVRHPRHRLLADGVVQGGVRRPRSRPRRRRSGLSATCEVVRIIPGLVLAFLESVIMAAISVAVSTRLPMLPNLVICGSIYVLGHLAALIVKSAAGEIVFVRFIGKLLSVILAGARSLRDRRRDRRREQRADVVSRLGGLLYSVLYSGAAISAGADLLRRSRLGVIIAPGVRPRGRFPYQGVYCLKRRRRRGVLPPAEPRAASAARSLYPALRRRITVSSVAHSSIAATIGSGNIGDAR